MINLGRLQVLVGGHLQGARSAAARGALLHPVRRFAVDRARLESETGATLVVRDRRGIRPTAAGATLVAHAEAIFAQVQAAEAELEAVLGVRAGRLRVASFPSAGATLVPLAVARFRDAHPAVALTLAEGEPEQIGPRLRAGEGSTSRCCSSSPACGSAQAPGCDRRRCSRIRCSSRCPPSIRSSPSRQSRWATWAINTGSRPSADSPCAPPRRALACLAAGFEPLRGVRERRL